MEPLAHALQAKLTVGHCPMVILMSMAIVATLEAADSTPFRDTNGEAQARATLEDFIKHWNTGLDENLRRSMNFPFVSFFPPARLDITETPGDFTQGFERMREQEGWHHSELDFDSLVFHMSSPSKVHCEITFHRYKTDGTRYVSANVMYVITEQKGHWGVQMRTLGRKIEPLAVAKREQMIEGSREAVKEFMSAFNTSNTSTVATPLNYPHFFFFPNGGVANALDASHRSVNPDFENMRQSQGWQFSSLDYLKPSIVRPNKVHWEVQFSRWHPDGTRYLTIPALWIVTRDADRWGIQLRSLMPPTFNAVEEPEN